MFDPLGLDATILFYGNILALWEEELTWDEPLPEILSKCGAMNVLHKLKLISQLKVPHFVGNVSDTCNYFVL